MTTLSERIAKNLNRVREIVKPYGARIIAVTKYVDTPTMEELYNQGIRDFGENKAKDGLLKINSLDEEMKLKSTYHFIGHLQTNKVKKVIKTFDYIHSVDSIDLANEISKVAQSQNIVQKVLIQVNNAQELQKFGIEPSKLNNLLADIEKLPNIEVAGLMNIAPLTENKDELRKLFSQMAKLKEAHHLKELSMGMSNDFEIALEEGATMIRLGNTLYK